MSSTSCRRCSEQAVRPSFSQRDGLSPKRTTQRHAGCVKVVQPEMTMIKGICLSACLVFAAAPAFAAGSSAAYGQGGWFEQFDPIVARYNQSGEEFRIQGHCQSACT